MLELGDESSASPPPPTQPSVASLDLETYPAEVVGQIAAAAAAARERAVRPRLRVRGL